MVRKRPLSVTLLGCLFIAAGVTGLVYHLTDFRGQHPFQNDIIWVSLVRLLAIVGGVFMFFGANWARWLILTWVAYHVVLSGFHSVSEFATHALLFAVVAYFLFRPDAVEYFRGSGAVQ
jgi:hypothetical protein